MALTQLQPFNLDTTGTYTFGNVTTTGTITAGGSTVAASVLITSIQITDSSYNVLDDTAISTSGGYIKITGSGFKTGAVIVIGSTNATATGFVNSTTLTAQIPALTAGTYQVYVVNTDGSVGLSVNGLTASGTPTWVTGSSLTNQAVDQPISIQLSATGDGSITYALAQGSSLPSGVTLSSSGLISGTVTGIVADTTYTFTVNAIDAQLQDSPRTFTMLVQITATTFTISPSVSGKSTWNLVTDGPLTLNTTGTWTIVPVGLINASITMWGAGGGAGTQGGTGGGGGYSTGTLQLSDSASYILFVGQGGRAGAGGQASGGGGSGDVNRGGGGGYTGIFLTSVSQANARMMAGAGGGAGGGSGSAAAGAGGGSSGQKGNNGTGAQPGGGTQLAGGASTGASSSNSGAALQGANGLSGGGGGYFGGASGGDNGSYAPGAGGGSGYLHSSVTSGTTTTGSLNTPAQSSNPLRGTAGNARSGSAGTGNDGLIYITLA